MLPIRTTMEDAGAICSYLITKPTGASVSEAKSVLDSKVLDGRKITAYRTWGLLDDSDGRYKITERGRTLAKNDSADRHIACGEIIRSIPSYAAIVERAVHRNENSLTAVDVASHWHEHFKADASDNDKILNDQAICFFHVAQCADLGQLVVGRKGQPTRFEFSTDNAKIFSSVEGNTILTANVQVESTLEEDQESALGAESVKNDETSDVTSHSRAGNNRVFITHGKNHKIRDQVKELVLFGKFEPVIAQENETAAKPVPQKVMEDMRSCSAAVIHIGGEDEYLDTEGNTITKINENVLIEIGAAMALYDGKFILLVEEGVKIPSNLQGLYECRYTGEELNMTATMKILKTFNEFK